MPYAQYQHYPEPGFVWSVIDSIAQNEESEIDYDYVMMMRNNKFEHTVEKLQTTLRWIAFFSSFWVMESDTFLNHSIA